MEKGKLAFDELRRIAADNGLTGMSLEEIRKVREGAKKPNQQPANHADC
ncbi:MAG: hypothetical protein J1D85_07130 [Bacteroidales bacterium]|nr:hypothetical protein [Bacteroidales bacterium]